MSRSFFRLTRACADFAGAALVFLMLVTVFDILMRRTGLLSVQGIVEMSTMAVVLIGFLALAYSFLQGGHIVIDLATAWLSPRANRKLDAIWSVVYSICLLFLSIMMWRATWKIYQDESVSLDLQLPMAMFWIPASLGMSLASVGCLVSAAGMKTETPKKDRVIVQTLE
jgi:TRAP-type C4-dicarboxylate transport system permease small subunit